MNFPGEGFGAMWLINRGVTADYYLVGKTSEKLTTLGAEVHYAEASFILALVVRISVSDRFRRTWLQQQFKFYSPSLQRASVGVPADPWQR